MWTKKTEAPKGIATTREIADAIDALIQHRIKQATNPPTFGGPPADDEAELIVRKIADGLKDHSASKGVYKDK